MAGPFRLLFVCLGNICRSPAAEGVMRHILEREGLLDCLEAASAGTGGWHVGQLPDSRMRQHAAKRGYILNSRARQFRLADLNEFDLILAMDRHNLRDLQALARNEAGGEKFRLFGDFVRSRPGEDVPDPYYGGAAGFETVLDQVEDGCRGILRKLKPELNLDAKST